MARMTRMSLATFESLRNTDSGLFHALLEATKAELGGKTVVVDSASIRGESFKIAWGKWVERHPEAILSKDSEQSELWQVQQEDGQRAAQKVREQQAVTRANWWIAEGNLLPSDHNLELIQRFIREKTQGLSAESFDLAVNQLREQLQWKPKPVAPAVVPAVPVEPPPPTLIDDPDSPTGKSEQLSLDEQPRSRHSKAQLRDWDARRRAEQQRQIRENNNAVAAAFRDAAAVNTPALEVEVV